MGVMRYGLGEGIEEAFSYLPKLRTRIWQRFPLENRSLLLETKSNAVLLRLIFKVRHILQIALVTIPGGVTYYNTYKQGRLIVITRKGNRDLQNRTETRSDPSQVLHHTHH